MNISYEIERLLQYAYKHGLVEKLDIIPCRNSLLDLFNVDSPYTGEVKEEVPEKPTEILDNIIDYGNEIGMLENNSDTFRDLLDAKIMGLLMPRQSEVANNFWKTARNRGVKTATDKYYYLSKKSNYIREDRIARNSYWKADTDYGELEITINLSKPEKDPKAIAAARSSKENKYPECFLCLENVGYAGRVDHYARQNHRVIPLRIAGKDWYFQYSPYSYYNEHCIIFSENHEPMRIYQGTFRKMFDFIDQFPHYFVGSNADLPIVGGSILSHDHFQGGRHEFPMAKSKIEREFESSKYPDVEVGIVKWPMSVVRLRGKDQEELVSLSDEILTKWRNYDDKKVGILSKTGDTQHNTITPIARKRGAFFEIDLVLRNNRCSDEYPDGIFHPHKELHNIKKENIGLIEVMGLAVLPGRLKSELKVIEDAIIDGDSLDENDVLKKHKHWIENIQDKYENFESKKEISEILQKEVGLTFGKVLNHAGVYKRDEVGQKRFDKFLESII